MSFDVGIYPIFDYGLFEGSKRTMQYGGRDGTDDNCQHSFLQGVLIGPAYDNGRKCVRDKKRPCRRQAECEEKNRLANVFVEKIEKKPSVS